MIDVQLGKILEERGLTIQQLSEMVDITPVNISVLKNNRARAIRFSTLEALCKALDCQPGDILRYIPE
ncbi:MAG: helix-turn-helix transcriptional regulator [Actinomycetaceae bacterium]|nr:helix-turn-helix transcriptional regulator [Actinomycetaceae bacterium]